MTISSISRAAQKFTIDNSPTILTGLGCAGVLTTAGLAAKGAYDLGQNMGEWTVEVEGLRRDGLEVPELTGRDKLRMARRYFLPAGVAGGLTIACIIGANRIGTRRAAALAAAFTISERAYAEYQEKVVERLGAGPEQEVRDEIAQDRLSRTEGSSEVVIVENMSLFMDAFSGRYFRSTVEDIKKAQNDTNFQLLNEGYASLTDFYQRIGLPQTRESEEVGWTSDKKLDVVFSWGGTEDQQPCGVIDFRVMPVRDYWRA